MKLVGITLFWVGIVMFLKSIGLVQIVDSSLVWAVVLIVLGSLLKHGCRHGMKCGMMGGCKMCKDGIGDGKVCEQCGK